MFLEHFELMMVFVIKPVAPPTGVKDDNDHSYDDYDSHDIMMMTTIKFTGLVRGESLPVAPPTGVSIFFSVLLSNRQLLSWK